MTTKLYPGQAACRPAPHPTRRGLLGGAAAAFCLPLAAPAVAQANFPSRPIEVLVPWGPGGGPSTISEVVRSVSAEDRLSPQPLVLNHKPGASGMIGSALVSGRRGDPHLFMPGGGALLLQAVTRESQVDPVTGLTPLALSSVDSCAIIVRADSPFRTLDDMFKASRRAPRAVSIATVGGSYSFDDLTTKVVNLMSEVELNQIPFNGGAEVHAAVLGGQVDVGARQLASAMTLIRAGQLRVLCIFDPERNPLLPEAPTAKELGYDYAYQLPRAWFGAPGISREAVAWYDQFFKRISEAPKFVTWNNNTGSLNKYLGSADFTVMVQDNMATYRRLFTQMGLIR